MFAYLLTCLGVAVSAVVMPKSDPRKAAIASFEKVCMGKIDPKFFMKAIMKAKCPKGVAGPGHATKSAKERLKGKDTLFFEDFEHGLGEWRGKNGAKTPHSAVITTDPDPSHKHVLHTRKCTGGGDAFSAATMKCTLKEPCVVEYDHKGRVWQGFANGYPGSHTWSATPAKYKGTCLACTPRNV